MKCKVFSATKARDREDLGTAVTSFIQDGLRDGSVREVLDKTVTQSSDNEFHCLSIVLWYK